MIKKISAILLLLLSVNQLLQAQTSKRLNNNWEFVKQDLGGVWEALRPVKAGNPEELPFWQKVKLKSSSAASSSHWV